MTAVARCRTVAVVHRSVVVVAVAIVVPIVVAVVVPVPIVVVAVAIVVSIMVAVVVPVPVMITIIIMISVVVAVAVTRWWIWLVEVVSGIEASASVAMATPESHKHCGTVEEHPVDGVAGVDGESPATGAPGERAIEPLACHEAVVLPCAEHEAQVAVADFPPETEHVGAGIYVEQVVTASYCVAVSPSS